MASIITGLHCRERGGELLGDLGLKDADDQTAPGYGRGKDLPTRTQAKTHLEADYKTEPWSMYFRWTEGTDQTCRF